MRTRSERPNCRRTADQRDEVATFHSITSSAVARSVEGILSPSALAVLRLMSISSFVGNSKGKLPAFSPLAVRPPRRSDQNLIISEVVSVTMLAISGACAKLYTTYCSIYSFSAEDPSIGSITLKSRNAASLAV